MELLVTRTLRFNLYYNNIRGEIFDGTLGDPHTKV